MLIKNSTIPVSAKGKSGTSSVSVRENGQIGFSSIVSKALNGSAHCILDWDTKGRTMTFTPVTEKTLPKGWVLSDCLEIKSSKGKSKDRKDRYISRADIFKMPDINYDYRAAGTHTFAATVSDKGVIAFQLPKEMPKADKVKRAPRKPKTAAAGAGTAPASAASAANAGNDGPELKEAA